MQHCTLRATDAAAAGAAQVIGLFEFVNLPFSSAVSLWIQIGGVAELNLEIMQVPAALRSAMPAGSLLQQAGGAGG